MVRKGGKRWALVLTFFFPLVFYQREEFLLEFLLSLLPLTLHNVVEDDASGAD